jgi:hypothetical protein
MKNKITILLCFFTVSISFGQYDWSEGAIVFKDGDTLKGQIKILMISHSVITFNKHEKVQYRSNEKSKKSKYDETQVKKVLFTNSDTAVTYFEYVQISKNKKGLFRAISPGKATLYARNVRILNSAPRYTGNPNGGAWVNSSFSSNGIKAFNEFYVRKKGEKIASPLINAGTFQSFRQRAMEYFYDCPILADKIDRKIYGIHNVKAVVDEYNQCR